MPIPPYLEQKFYKFWNLLYESVKEWTCPILIIIGIIVLMLLISLLIKREND